MRSGGAHPQYMPSVEHANARGFQRQREMQYRCTRLGVVADGAGHQKIACRHAAPKNLSRVDAPPSFDALGFARTIEPIRSSSADQYQSFIDDTAQEGFDRLRVPPPTPDDGRHKMRVHRQSERR
jgi:hypothetical protein